jgi:PAS domain S-box-containing protein
MVLSSNNGWFSRLREGIRGLSLLLKWKELDLYSHLLDGISDYAIFMLDPDGRVTSWTKTAANIFGYTSSEMIGSDFAQIYQPEAVRIGKPVRELRMAAAHSRFEDTGWRVRSDGSLFWANVIVSPIMRGHGHVEGFIVIVRDITEFRNAQNALKLKEQELEGVRKIEAIGRLAGGIAHDFNNLLAGIIGMSEEVFDDLPTTSPMRPNMREIISTAQQASVLTRQLLAFGRKHVPQSEILHVNTAIQNLAKMLRRFLSAEVELNFLLSPEAGYICTDEGQLEQIVINLVLNARDAIQNGGGRIQIETQRRLAENQDYAVLRVSDTGTGMSAETLSHLFEPFYTTKGSERGTGLGLATIHGIVKQNQGEILVQSELGKGSCFEVLLPQANAPQESNSPLALSSQSAPGTETILLVDDSDIVNRVSKGALLKQGYTVLTAKSAEEAIEQSARHAGAIHLLLTDIVMPGMNGLKLAEIMRGMRPDIAVLYISGYSEDVIAYRENMRSDFVMIQKPFTLDFLMSKVRDVLDKRTLARPVLAGVQGRPSQ